MKNDKFSNENIFGHMGLKEKNEYYSSHLFTFFYKFIPENSRIDVIEKAGINKENDNEYEILKKVANLDLNKNQFWIGLWLWKTRKLKIVVIKMVFLI